VADGDGLENRSGSNVTGGSNPSPSAGGTWETGAELLVFAASSPSVRRTPASWAVGDSGYSDTSDNVDVVLAGGFGLSRVAD
jgi:hypothetical protein